MVFEDANLGLDTKLEGIYVEAFDRGEHQSFTGSAPVSALATAILQPEWNSISSRTHIAYINRI